MNNLSFVIWATMGKDERREFVKQQYDVELIENILVWANAMYIEMRILGNAEIGPEYSSIDDVKEALDLFNARYNELYQGHRNNQGKGIKWY